MNINSLSKNNKTCSLSPPIPPRPQTTLPPPIPPRPQTTLQQTHCDQTNKIEKRRCKKNNNHNYIEINSNNLIDS
jgi:hypothetical protein